MSRTKQYISVCVFLFISSISFAQISESNKVALATNYYNPISVSNDGYLYFDPLKVKDKFDHKSLQQLMLIWETNGTICGCIGHYWYRKASIKNKRCIMCDQMQWHDLPSSITNRPSYKEEKK